MTKFKIFEWLALSHVLAIFCFMTQEKEIWVPVVGFEGSYEVSSLGRVKSLINGPTKRSHKIGDILPTHPSTRKYEKIFLIDPSLPARKRRKEFGLHQLVYFSFNKISTKDGYEVDHINGDPSDNKLSNLQYICHAKNIGKYYIDKPKTSKYTGVYWCKASNKWRVSIRFKNKRINLGGFEIHQEDEAGRAYIEAFERLYSTSF